MSAGCAMSPWDHQSTPVRAPALFPRNQDRLRKPLSCPAPCSSPAQAFVQQPQGAAQQPSTPKSKLERCVSASPLCALVPRDVWPRMFPAGYHQTKNSRPHWSRKGTGFHIRPPPRKERDNKPQSPPWILLSKKEFQQQTHTYKEPPASRLSALASDSSALQPSAVWSPV